MSKIAVVIPVYNGEKSIKKAICSLELQTFEDWIGIIVNDGSMDSTANYLAKLDANKFIIIHLNVNKGRGFARQVALEKIRNLEIPYMCMLDADDWYYPNKLTFQFDFMEENKNFTLMSTSMVVNNVEKLGKAQPFANFKKLFFNKYSNFILLPHAPSIIRMKDISGFNYNENYKYSEDKDFLRKILLNKEYCFIPEITYCYNREFSFSYNKYKNSLLIDNNSYCSLTISRFSKVYYSLCNYVKILFIKCLSVLGKLEFYFSKSNGSITNQEKIDFFMQLKKIENEN